MKTALSLGLRNVGLTAPNPSVGALVVKDGAIIGRGVTAKGGRPHAEPIALEMAGPAAKAASLYVSLEPCCHTGKTPPCTDAIIKAGIKQVIISAADSDLRVKGQGIEKLRAAGIDVITGVLEEEGRDANKGFFKRLEENRPYVTLKIACSLDGKIALSNGESKWITGEESRNYGHLLRSRNDAILTGIGTVLKDDPELTCRLPGLEGRSPQRIVLDSELRIDAKCKLVKSAGETPTIIFTSPHHSRHSGENRNDGVYIIEMKKNQRGLDLQEVVKKLAELGINNLMVEAGGRINASFLKENLVDEIALFVAPKIIGADGIPAIGGMDIAGMKSVPGFKIEEQKTFGADMFYRLTRLESVEIGVK